MIRLKSNPSRIFRFPLLLLSLAIVGPGLVHAQTFPPVITQLSPSSIPAGGTDFTLTVLGAQFDPNAVVLWNGSARDTTFIDYGILQATILEQDIAIPDTTAIQVENPDGSVSDLVTFTITPDTSFPVLQSIIPAIVQAGSAGFQMTVTGDGFIPQSMVLWDNVTLATTYIDSSLVLAYVPAVNVAQIGSALISVQNRVPVGPVSDPLSIEITSISTQYLPQVAVGGGYTTVITLLNNSSQDADGNLIFTGQSGNPLMVAGSMPDGTATTDSSFAFTIPAGGMRIFTAQAVNPADPVQSGWARIDSSLKLVAEATFQTSQGTVLTSIAGVLPAQATNAVAIPITDDAAAGSRTGIALANTSDHPLHIRLVVVDANGNNLDIFAPPELNPLEPGHQVAKFLDEFLPQYTTFRGSVIFDAQKAGDLFTAVALSFRRSLNGSDLMSVFPVDLLSVSTGQEATLYFPQVAAGGGYTTVLTLINTGSGVAVGRLKFNDQSGGPEDLAVASDSAAPAIGSDFPISIPSGGIRILTVTSPVPGGPVMSGWAHLETMDNRLNGVATFQTMLGGVPTSIAGVLPAQPGDSATIPVDNDAGMGRRTGFAVANQGDAPVNLRLRLIDENGSQVAEVKPPQLNSLPPGAQIAVFLDQILPQYATFRGSMILDDNGAGTPFVAVALLQNRGLTSLGLISVLPVNQ